MAKKLCYVCSKKYAVGKVLHYPLCRKCKREVKMFSKKALRYECTGIEDKLLNGNRKFDSKKDFRLGLLLVILGTIIFTLAACLRYGGF